MPKLSTVILSYNTSDLLRDCLTSLKRNEKEVDLEIIVSDNGSSDGSIAMVKKEFPSVNVIENQENLGFARGNNQARKVVKGEYILFLNSDTEVQKNTLKEVVKQLESDPLVGALTCKIVLPSGKLDKDARRSFPTPWVALTHFSYLDRIFSGSKIFSKYWYGYLSPDVIHEVDAIQGAFFLVRRKVLEEVNWFDEDYFLDGEDIDLCWKIAKEGYKIIYYPKVSITHIKGASKGKNIHLKSRPSIHDRLHFIMSGVDSMEIFYKKRLQRNYPLIINTLVLTGIQILKIFRYLKLLK